MSEHDDGYHVVVARGDDVLVNEVHPSCDAALQRADDLRSQLRGRPRGIPPRPLTRH